MAIDPSGALFDTAVNLFQPIGSTEYYRTIGFKEIAMIYGDTESSFRKTAQLINHVRYQEEAGTPHRSLQSSTEREGLAISGYQRELCEKILLDAGFTATGEDQDEQKVYPLSRPTELSEEQVDSAFSSLTSDYHVQGMRNNPVLYEDPDKAVNFSVDDVTVKKQAETRPTEKDGKQKVNNTIAHVKRSGLSYTLNGGSIKEVLIFILGFIIHNELLGYRLQFFTDGHRALNDAIRNYFGWYKNLGIILDWFHLVKKCKEKK